MALALEPRNPASTKIPNLFSRPQKIDISRKKISLAMSTERERDVSGPVLTWREERRDQETERDSKSMSRAAFDKLRTATVITHVQWNAGRNDITVTR